MPPSMNFNLEFPDDLDEEMPVDDEMDYASGYKQFLSNNSKEDEDGPNVN